MSGRFLFRIWMTATVALVLLCDVRVDAVVGGIRSTGNRLRTNKGVERGTIKERKLGHKREKCEGPDGYKGTCPPSSSPSMSSYPSSAPTNLPSAMPSESEAPSARPSVAPSTAPTFAPTTSPSHTPSLSSIPSSTPSRQPTSMPTTSPSNQPSLSLSPTDPIFSQSEDENGFDVSACLAPLPQTASSTTETSMLSFEYFMYLADTSDSAVAQGEADGLESEIHIALAREAMVCDYTQDFSLIGLSAADMDMVVGPCPSVTPEAGQLCWQVNGKITTEFFFLNRRRMSERGLIESGVLDALIVWMNAIFQDLADTDNDILNLDFQGFGDIATLYGVQLSDSQQLQEDTTGSAAALAGNIPLDDKKDNGGFVFLVILAALGLVGVVLFIITRRNKRQEAYLQHAEQVDEISLDEDAKADMAIKSGIVDVLTEEEPVSFEEFEGVEIEDANHDYRTCASPRCQLCLQETKRPVFISTGKDQTEVIASLSPPINHRNSDTSSKVEDIQML